MKPIEKIKQLTDQELLEASNTFHSAFAFLKSININPHPRNGKELNILLKSQDLKWLSHNRYEKIKKTCPICLSEFTASKNSPREKITCSYSCANTHFRSGENNSRWKAGGNSYRIICFIHHKKECIICKEDRVVEVHHYDCNKSNNHPNNLIPLCPNHHQFFHSKHVDDVKKQIDDYHATLNFTNY